MRNRPRSLWRPSGLLAVLLPWYLLTGCGKPPPSPPAAPPPATLQVTDDTGRTVEFATAPQRIISCHNGFTEMLLALGAKQRLVGVTKAAAQIPEAAGITRVGTHAFPDVETVRSLQPDLLIATIGVAPKERFLALEQYGMKVLIFRPGTLEEVCSVMERLGTVLALGPEAQTTVDKLRARIAAVRTAVAGKPPVKVFCEHSLTPLKGSGTSSIANDLITTAGGVNLVKARERLVPFSMEELVSADPDVYLISVGPMNPREAAPLQRKAFARLRAFRTQRVYQIEQNQLTSAGPRCVDGLERVAHLLHPEAFAKRP